MGAGTFRAKVRGRRGACHAFLGAVSTQRCYECDNDGEMTFGGECELRMSGWTKGLLWLSEYNLGKKMFQPVEVPDDPDEAEELGRKWARGKIVGIQGASQRFGVEVWLTQTDDEDREEEGDTISYVHYRCGEAQPDCHSQDFPRELWLPVGGCE